MSLQTFCSPASGSLWMARPTGRLRAGPSWQRQRRRLATQCGGSRKKCSPGSSNSYQPCNGSVLRAGLLTLARCWCLHQRIIPCAMKVITATLEPVRTARQAGARHGAITQSDGWGARLQAPCFRRPSRPSAVRRPSGPTEPPHGRSQPAPRAPPVPPVKARRPTSCTARWHAKPAGHAAQ